MFDYAFLIVLACITVIALSLSLSGHSELGSVEKLLFLIKGLAAFSNILV